MNDKQRINLNDKQVYEWVKTGQWSPEQFAIWLNTVTDLIFEYAAACEENDESETMKEIGSLGIDFTKAVSLAEIVKKYGGRDVYLVLRSDSWDDTYVAVVEKPSIKKLVFKLLGYEETNKTAKD